MTSGIVPRPIAFVSTRSEQGYLNLAPFSFFQMLVNDPPLVMICPGTLRDPQTHDKNTTANIKETKEFTINVVSDAFAEAMNWSSVDMPLSEWFGTGLTPLESVRSLSCLSTIDRVERYLRNSSNLPESRKRLSASSVIFILSPISSPPRGQENGQAP
jgi:flavin reductase (DIM6/NTAB) family NADH-FMN oxidoreductase RutF